MIIDIRESVDCVVALLFLGILSWHTYLRYGKLIGISTFYFFSSALIIFMNPYHMYSYVFPQKIHISVGYVSAQAFVSGLLIFLFVAFAKKETIFKSFEILKYFAVLNAALAAFAPTPWNGGAFWGNSFDGTFGMFFLPFFLESIKTKKKLDQLALFILALATVKIGSASPFITAFIVLFMYYFKPTPQTIFLSLCGFLSLLSGVIYYIIITPGHVLERVYVWEKVLLLYFQKFNPILGTGIGTYRIVGPMLQWDRDNVFYFLHNEPLQILMEGGFVGFILFMLLLKRVYKSFNQKEFVICTTATLLMSLLHYPLRVGIGFFFVIILVRIAFEQSEEWKCRTQE